MDVVDVGAADAGVDDVVVVDVVVEGTALYIELGVKVSTAGVGVTNAGLAVDAASPGKTAPGVVNANKS